MAVTYLVSGHVDIAPTHENLRRAGRRVRHDRDVDLDAARALRSPAIVISHGSAAGTITWVSSVDGVERDWLWVGMDQAPQNVRVYLYSCSAGPALRRFLRSSEVLGHCDRVPMPVDNARDVVISFLGEVEKAMLIRQSTAADWEARIGKYINARVAEALEGLTSDGDAVALLYLQKSLGYAID